jgi:hypothetical protein
MNPAIAVVVARLVLKRGDHRTIERAADEPAHDVGVGELRVDNIDLVLANVARDLQDRVEIEEALGADHLDGQAKLLELLLKRVAAQHVEAANVHLEASPVQPLCQPQQKALSAADRQRSAQM